MMASTLPVGAALSGRSGLLSRPRASNGLGVKPRLDYGLDRARDGSPDEAIAFAELIERVACDKDRLAFTGLFNHFAPRIKAYLLHRGLRDAEAEARAIESMVAIWRGAASFDRDQTSVCTWIFRLVRNGCDDRPCRDLRGERQ